MSRLKLLERVSLWAAALGVLLILATAGGCPTFEATAPAWAWPLHLLLLAASAAAGMATMLRGVEIDRERWRIVDDPRITRGEREYAHKEAERQRRWAGTALMLGPVIAGYWLAFQFRSAGTGRLLTDLLSLTPLAGFLAGLVYGRRYGP